MGRKMGYQNPYSNIAGINSRDLFFGRQDIIFNSLNTLFADTPGCFSIVGQRKIGKTSLLQHVVRPSTIIENKFSTDHCVFIQLNCQSRLDALENMENFYRALLDLILENLPEHLRSVLCNLPNNQNTTLAWKAWQGTLKALRKENIRVITIFDEFDKAIWRKGLHDEGLFDNLRGFAQDHDNFCWVTSTHQQLRDLFKGAWNRYDIPDYLQASQSEFYNIAPARIISLLDDTAISELIKIPSSSGGVIFASDEIQQIKKIGGYFPYFIQRACYHYFDYHLLQTKPEESPDQLCIEEILPFWIDFWDGLSTRSQRILSAIACDRDTKASDVEVHELIAAALVHKDSNSGHLSLFSDDFAYFIQRKSRTYNSIIQVNQWVDNHRYQIQTLVDSTPSSQVVKALDSRLDVTKAIKFVRTEEDLDEQRIQDLQGRLRREAKILFELDHKHIGKIHDIIDDPMGIVMEWVDGCSLKDLIGERKRIPIKKVIEIGIQLADALTYIHDHMSHIVHRDIKPANIILIAEGKIKLIDFGIAHDRNVDTISCNEDGVPFQIGTPRYSSPEQFSLVDIGPATDIFSSGIVLYELLTFEKPYKYGNRLDQYENNHFPKPEQYDMPEPLFKILCTMLAEKPSMRPDAKTLKHELQNYLEFI